MNDRFLGSNGCVAAAAAFGGRKQAVCFLDGTIPERTRTLERHISDFRPGTASLQAEATVEAKIYLGRDALRGAVAQMQAEAALSHSPRRYGRVRTPLPMPE